MTFLEWRDKWFENDGASIYPRYIGRSHQEWFDGAEYEISAVQFEDRWRCRSVLDGHGTRLTAKGVV